MQQDSQNSQIRVLIAENKTLRDKIKISEDSIKSVENKAK
jgi:hypothetical protein